MTKAVRLARVLLAATLAALALPSSPAVQSPADFEAVRRELDIGADVLRAALAKLLPESQRVVDVEAGFLPGQGVLVVIDLASPWFRLHEHRIDIGPEITSLEQIPDMVHDILTDLNVGLPRHQVEELEELREIRDAQRLVRSEQRALRFQLREKRRALQRAEEEDAAAALRRDIQRLQAELAAAEAEERSLQEDAAAVRQTLEQPADAAGDPDSMPTEVDLAVADAVCRYGATFHSLDPGQHLNVLMRHAGVSRYYVFRMDRVRSCRADRISPERLLEESFSYTSRG